MRSAAQERRIVTAEDVLAAEIAHWEEVVAQKAHDVSAMAVEVQDLKNALSVFLGEYNSRVGVHYAALDRLDLHIEIYEYRIRRLFELGVSNENGVLVEDEVENKFRERMEEVKKQEEDMTRSSDEFRASLSRRERWEMLSEDVRRRIKVVYRKLALRFHPDKAGDDAERQRLHEIMAAINQAYADGDLDVLILYVEQAEKEDRLKLETPFEKLERLKQEAQKLTGMLAGLCEERTKIRETDTWRLKCQVDKKREEGGDLLAELTRRLRNEIKQKEAMLEELVGRYRQLMREHNN
jgi:hypothetical protein